MKETYRKKQEENKIVLESCPGGGKHCMGTLKKLNDLLSKANTYVNEKEFDIVVEFKLKAFEETFKIKQQQCLKCTLFFREIIYDSLSENEKELRKFTTGFFKRKKYIYQLESITKALDYMRKKMI